MTKIEKKILASIWLQFSKNTNSKFEKKIVLLRDRATLPLFDLSPNTTIYAQRLLSGSMSQWPNSRRFFGHRPISRPKIENFTITKCFSFSILHTHTKFQASRFNNKKKFVKVIDPLKRWLQKQAWIKWSLLISSVINKY